MKTHEDLLFAEVAVLLDLISRDQVDKKLKQDGLDSVESFAQQAVDAGWINESERADIEKLVAAKISKHDHNPEAGSRSGVCATQRCGPRRSYR
jgi:hypothetical protein